MSDSVRPYRRQLTRLPHPWDTPGKNTGVGCPFLLQCVKVKSFSRVRPSATPWTAAFQAPPSTGFSRQEYWSRVPLPSLMSLEVSYLNNFRRISIVRTPEKLSSTEKWLKGRKILWAHNHHDFTEKLLFSLALHSLNHWGKK